MPTGRGGGRGGYGRLSRQRMLASALELVDREGLAALSMRRLGAELGVEAMALYRHAASKDELLDGLVEVLYAELEERRAADEGRVPRPAGSANPPSWRARLHCMARATYEVCLAHPRAAPLLTTRMLDLPLARRPPVVLEAYGAVIVSLREAGLGERRVSLVFRAFLTWVHGYPAVDLSLMDSPRDPPEFRAVTASGLQGGTAGLAAGLDALLDRLVGPEGSGNEAADPPT
ncbi:TetR/AcrR family transcriptional regulator [Streptomyces sp. NPDC003395]